MCAKFDEDVDIDGVVIDIFFMITNTHLLNGFGQFLQKLQCIVCFLIFIHTDPCHTGDVYPQFICAKLSKGPNVLCAGCALSSKICPVSAYFVPMSSSCCLSMLNEYMAAVTVFR